MINDNIIPQITALIEEVLKETEEENGNKKTLHDIEVCIQNLTMKIQTLLLEFMVNMRKAAYQGSTLRCDCGGKLKLLVYKKPFPFPIPRTRINSTCHFLGGNKVFP